MKIVEVCEFYSDHGGGVRTYVRQKLAAAAVFGHKILIIAPGPDDREEHVGGGRIRWVKSPAERFDARYHRFAAAEPVHDILTREAPDVVEASSPWNGGRIVASWAGEARRILVLHNDPVAVYAHSFLDGFLSADRIDRMFGRLWRRLAALSAQFDETIVAGHWLARRFANHGIARCRVIPFGIDKQLFTPNLRDAARRQWMLKSCGLDDPDAPLMIAVARHHPEKRIGVLVDAMARVRHRRPAGLLLVGDGPLRGWVERIAAQIDGVCVAGTLDRPLLAECLASADLLVHAGAAETFGLAVAEGLCSGLPMVLPDRGGAADLASPAFSELYTTGDAAACAAAIERLLERPRADLKAAALSAAVCVRSSEEHFADLFGHYAQALDLEPIRTAA